jgi:hypothetical protein
LDGFDCRRLLEINSVEAISRKRTQLPIAANCQRPRPGISSVEAISRKRTQLPNDFDDRDQKQKATASKRFSRKRTQLPKWQSTSTLFAHNELGAMACDRTF